MRVLYERRCLRSILAKRNISFTRAVSDICPRISTVVIELC